MTTGQTAVTMPERYVLTVGRTNDGRVAALAVDSRFWDEQGRVEIDGWLAEQVAAPARDLLIAERVTTVARWAKLAAVPLSQDVGRQVDLLLRAVRPLHRVDRAALVAAEIANMSLEEAAYWHAQARRPRGLEALRVLVAS